MPPINLLSLLGGQFCAFVEVHLSNIHKREPFRHHSYFSDAAEGVICGCGAQGYEFALQFALNYLAEKRNLVKIDEK